jgi:hypothetical protein
MGIGDVEEQPLQSKVRADCPTSNIITIPVLTILRMNGVDGLQSPTQPHMHAAQYRVPATAQKARGGQ